MGCGDKEQPKLLIPHYPQDSEGAPYEVYTLEDKLVSEYTGLSFKEISEINIIEYLIYLRDGFIYKKYKTPEGIEYLNDCKRLLETEPDIKGLKETFGRG